MNDAEEFTDKPEEKAVNNSTVQFSSQYEPRLGWRQGELCKLPDQNLSLNLTYLLLSLKTTSWLNEDLQQFCRDVQLQARLLGKLTMAVRLIYRINVSFLKLFSATENNGKQVVPIEIQMLTLN